jgi:quercetin dioxygenase-like cupin family protein
MVEIYNLENYTNLDTPRHMMKYVFLFCSSGNLSLRIDESTLDLSSGQVVTITSGQIHSIAKSSNAKGFTPLLVFDFNSITNQIHQTPTNE